MENLPVSVAEIDRRKLQALMRMAKEVALGMYHLHCDDVVHGDLVRADGCCVWGQCS